MGTAYSELVDPVVRRERLVAQPVLAGQGGPEAMRLDEEFLRAMEYGMPPNGGLGIGIDPLLMALTVSASEKPSCSHWFVPCDQDG